MFAPTTAAQAFGRVARAAEIRGAKAMAVRLYAAPKVISDKVGGLVGLFSMPATLTIVTVHGPPERTSATVAAHIVAAAPMSLLPVGSKPSRHAMPMT